AVGPSSAVPTTCRWEWVSRTEQIWRRKGPWSSTTRTRNRELANLVINSHPRPKERAITETVNPFQSRKLHIKKPRKPKRHNMPSPVVIGQWEGLLGLAQFHGSNPLTARQEPFTWLGFFEGSCRILVIEKLHQRISCWQWHKEGGRPRCVAEPGWNAVNQMGFLGVEVRNVPPST